MADSGLSQRSHQALLNSMFGKTSNFGVLASAPTIYVGLSTTKPTTAGTNITEPSSGSYARVATSGSDWTSATDADPSETENANEIAFPTPSGDWASGADMLYAVLFDASSSGNFLVMAKLGTPIAVLNGDDPVRFAPGALKVRLGATPD